MYNRTRINYIAREELVIRVDLRRCGGTGDGTSSMPSAASTAADNLPANDNQQPEKFIPDPPTKAD